METSIEVLRQRVNRILKWGIVFSIVWAAGIGSAISIICGVRAYKILKKSDIALSGIGRVWWCFIVGGFGVLFWFPLIIIGVINNLGT